MERHAADICVFDSGGDYPGVPWYMLSLPRIQPQEEAELITCSVFQLL